MDSNTDASTKIFVFGSNTAGRHGKGAARDALKLHGAIFGRGKGIQGRSYAIPTKDGKTMRTLPLDIIAGHVEEFKAYAAAHPKMTFTVTKVGCGLAGIPEDTMKAMFRGCPENCILPEGW